jgi:hypothetical protein
MHPRPWRLADDQQPRFGPAADDGSRAQRQHARAEAAGADLGEQLVEGGVAVFGVGRSGNYMRHALAGITLKFILFTLPSTTDGEILTCRSREMLVNFFRGVACPAREATANGAKS